MIFVQTAYTKKLSFIKIINDNERDDYGFDYLIFETIEELHGYLLLEGRVVIIEN